MAEEQDILAELEAGEEAAAKGGFPWKIIIILVLVAALGGGGYYGWMMFQQSQAESADETTKPADEKTEERGSAVSDTPAPSQVETESTGPLGVMVTLEPFIVNLSGSQGKRFLKVTMTLEVNAPEVHGEVKTNRQRIVDSILVLLSSKTFEEVYSVQGKFKLKDEITTRVNRFLLMGHVKDVFFTEFVIQ